MVAISPWAQGPFELIVHAEEHRLLGGDFDRRIALISFDNAVEVSISTYLSLNPIQRGGRMYTRESVALWLNNYYTKIDFFEIELSSRNMISWSVEKSHILWVHDQRNEQYHGGNKGTPEIHVLEIIRAAAIWIWSVLYDVPDAEKVLEEVIKARAPASPPASEDELDKAIDNEYGLIEVAGQMYYASEILFAVDRDAYKEMKSVLLLRDIPKTSE